MGKTVNLIGFPESSTTEDVRKYLENISGSDMIHAIKVKKTLFGDKFHAIVHFTYETYARKVIT